MKTYNDIENLVGMMPTWNTDKIISALISDVQRYDAGGDTVELDSFVKGDDNETPTLFARVKIHEDHIEVISADFFIDGSTMRTLNNEELDNLEKLLN